MITRLFSFFGEYKKYAVLAPLTIVVESILEILIPYLMAKIIDVGIANGDMRYVLTVGGMMMLMAMLGLACGAAAGRFAAVAAMGFAKIFGTLCLRRCRHSPFPIWINSAPRL